METTLKGNWLKIDFILFPPDLRTDEGTKMFAQDIAFELSNILESMIDKNHYQLAALYKFLEEEFEMMRFEQIDQALGSLDELISDKY